MCKSSGTQPENNKVWIATIQALIAKETTSKAHIQVHTNKESREKQPGRKPKSKRAWADRPSPFRARFEAPFDLAAIQKSWFVTGELIRHPPPQDQEQEANWIAKEALVAFIYFGGFDTMISTIMSNIMR
jgi:hypothetical protein